MGDHLRGAWFPRLAGLLRGWLYRNDLARKRASAEQFMTAQCHSETVKDQIENKHPERVRAILAKKSRAQHEVRKQSEIERKLREARQLQSIISNLEREVANLDDSIISELALSSVREPSHFAYPISARMMKARRQNLKTTIAALSDRLSSGSQPVAEPDNGLLKRAIVHRHI
jgi:flagellar protein FliJ